MLLVFTMPLWAALFAWLLHGARPTVRGALALALGATGVAVLFGDQSLGFEIGRAHV